MPKRLFIWFIETISEVLLLGVVLAVLLGHDQNAFIKDVFIYSSGVALLFFTTGYFLSTVFARAFWRGQTLWFYPTVATVLFFVHFEIMNLAVGRAFEPKDRLRILPIGACIAFASTLVGTFALRKWTAERTITSGIDDAL